MKGGEEFKAYPKIASLGTKGFERIIDVPVYIQEKLDGSNVSIHKIQGSIQLASRTRWLGHLGVSGIKMFNKFLEWVNINEHFLNKLPEGAVLWGEFCNNHNVLKYEKLNPFVLFDISLTDPYGNRQFIPKVEWRVFFDLWWGSPDYLLERFLPVFSSEFSKMPNLTTLKEHLEFTSILGGPREGIVIKNYTEMTLWGQPLFCKLVNAEYKEGHRTSSKSNAPTIEAQIAENYFNTPRLKKAIQRLKEEGTLTGSTKDIGPLIDVVSKDIYDEEVENIKVRLFNHHWKQITRVIASKVPPAYKEFLAKELENK